MSAVYIQLFSGSHFEARLTVQGSIGGDANILSFDGNTGKRITGDASAVSLTPFVRMGPATSGSGNDWSASFALVEGGISVVRTYIAPRIAGLNQLTILDRDGDSGETSETAATLVKPTNISVINTNTTNANFTIDSSNILKLTDSDSKTVQVDLSPYLDDTNTTVSSGSVTGSTLILTMSDGGKVSIDASSLLDNTDTFMKATANADGTIQLINADGSNGPLIPASIPDTNTTNANFTIDSSNILKLTDSDSKTVQVDLSPYLDDTNTTVSSGSVTGSTLILTMSDGGKVSIDASSLLDNTDTFMKATANADGTIQLINADGSNGPLIPASIPDTNTTNANFTIDSSNILKLTDSDSKTVQVDLSPYLDDTNTTVSSGSVTGSALILTMSDGGKVSIDASSLLDNTDTFMTAVTNANGTIQLINADGSNGPLIPGSVVDNYYCEFSTNTAFNPTPRFTKITFTSFSNQSLFSNSEYIATETGLYFVGMKIRVADNSPSTSFGIGAFTSVVHGGHFSWDQTGGKQRHTINYTQVLNLKANDTVKFFTYGSPLLTILYIAGLIHKI